LTIAVTSPSLAASCSDRNKVCLDFCSKNYSAGSRCTINCSNTFAQCKQTGCWASVMVAKQCGFTKN
jgi:hypothetical protein